MDLKHLVAAHCWTLARKSGRLRDACSTQVGPASACCLRPPDDLAVDGLMDLVYEDMRVQMIVQRNSITAAPYTLSPRAHAGAALSLPIRYAMNLG